MPTLDATEYERFRYDETPLTLDEATKQASSLRQRDTKNFYRVEHVDEGRTVFTVSKVPVASVYADFLAKIAKITNRTKFRSTR